MAPSLTQTGNVLLLIFTTTCEIVRIVTILQKTELKLRNVNDLLKVTQPGGCGTDTYVQGCLAPKPIYCFLLNFQIVLPYTFIFNFNFLLKNI